MAQTHVSERWFTAKEAADYLGLSEPTIFRWMRDGKLSYFKLGGSTRFRRENLDLVARKVTGRDESESRAARCAVCGHAFLLAGRVRSTGRIYFEPTRTKFFVLADSTVNLDARACPSCGHVEMFADIAKLDRLMRDEDAEASEKAEAEGLRIGDERS